MPSRERYVRYICSPEWNARRNRYYRRHGRACAFCGAVKWVELHHHTYERMGRELDDDLIAVCREHHQEIHSHHDRHPELTLTQATRQVAAQYVIEVHRRRVGPSKKQRNKDRKARRRERSEAQRRGAR
jgi:hypothetical protein